MIPLRKRFLTLLLGATLLPVIAQRTASAAPTFSIQDPPKFTYPLPDSTLNEFTLFVFSTEGNIPGSTVQVRDVKTADGDPRTSHAVKASLENTTVTPGGQKVTLTLDPRFFTIPAEYRITLSFQGANGTPALLTTVVINRLSADINLEELRDQTVTLTRWFPLASEWGFHIPPERNHKARDSDRSQIIHPGCLSQRYEGAGFGRGRSSAFTVRW